MALNFRHLGLTESRPSAKDATVDAEVLVEREVDAKDGSAEAEEIIEELKLSEGEECDGFSCAALDLHWIV